MISSSGCSCGSALILTAARASSATRSGSPNSASLPRALAGVVVSAAEAGSTDAASVDASSSAARFEAASSSMASSSTPVACGWTSAGVASSMYEADSSSAPHDVETASRPMPSIAPMIDAEMNRRDMICSWHCGSARPSGSVPTVSVQIGINGTTPLLFSTRCPSRLDWTHAYWANFPLPAADNRPAGGVLRVAGGRTSKVRGPRKLPAGGNFPPVASVSGGRGRSPEHVAQTARWWAC